MPRESNISSSKSNSSKLIVDDWENGVILDLVRASVEFELTEFEEAGFYCTFF